MSDQPDKPEDGDSVPGESAMPEPELLKPDDVHLSDPDVSADAVEPTLSTSADKVRVSEPSLGAAEISEDAAEAASVDEAAAEAESVAREAENVGTLVAGPRPVDDPAEAAAPSGTAPAGGTAGDGAAMPEDVPNPPVDGQDLPDHGAGGSGDEEKSGGLASFAASDGEPSWTGPAQEQARWDALFEAEQSSASADTADRPASNAQDAGDRPASGLPAGIPAPPAAAPGSPGQAPDGEQAPDGPEASAGAGTSTAPDAPAAPVAPWAPPYPVTHPQAPGSPVPPTGGPYGLPPAGPGEPAPKRSRARAAGSSSRGSNRKMLIILGIVGLVVIALLIFAITTIVNSLRSDDSDAGSVPNTTPGADGIIAENISPLELQAGACILGFDSTNVSADVTTVTCTTPHNAQLLATTSLPEDAEFPGEAALSASGDDLCNSAPIDENAAAGYTTLTLTQVTPTSGTWADGDRRIDCFVVSDEGNIITETLLAE